MKILDTSAVNFIMKNSIVLEERFYITPDILEEIYTLEIELSKQAPLKNLINIFEEESFDQAVYLKNYHLVINSVGGRSIYTMRGFGDVSLIALAITLAEKGEKLTSLKLPFKEMLEKHSFYLGDEKLKKRMEKAVGSDVEILTPESLL